jgi:hypothetical protein
VPAGRGEIRTALEIGYGERDRCRPELLRWLRAHGVDLAPYRDAEGANLFALAARCDSAEMVALAAAEPGVGINDLDDNGRTPLDSSRKREGAAARALVALGARECKELYGEDSNRCRGEIEPDPAL